MASRLGSDDDADNNKGSMCTLEQKLNQLMDEEAARLKNMYREKTEDIEGGTHKPKFQTDLTLPIYLKGTIIEASLYQSLINATNKLAI
ncbi:uncharacterized protein [Arachis hypogaea]|uniref:uncharacterized protein isoform X2 n=1 Tax=Arachis hypogaea TaxID=3818 RepID=UPI003B225790